MSRSFIAEKVVYLQNPLFCTCILSKLIHLGVAHAQGISSNSQLSELGWLKTSKGFSQRVFQAYSKVFHIQSLCFQILMWNFALIFFCLSMFHTVVFIYIYLCFCFQKMKLFLSKTQKLIDTLWRTTVCAELQSFYLFNWSEKSTTLNSVRKEC